MSKAEKQSFLSASMILIGCGAYVDMAVWASDPVGQTQLISTLSVGLAATVLAANLP